MSADDRQRVEHDLTRHHQRVERVFVSAQAGHGLSDLRRVLQAHAGKSDALEPQADSTYPPEAGL